MLEERLDSPLPGKIIKVCVTEGAEVQEGDEILFLESMKMENPILSPVNGEVTKIAIKNGDIVDYGTLLAIIEY